MPFLAFVAVLWPCCDRAACVRVCFLQIWHELQNNDRPGRCTKRLRYPRVACSPHQPCTPLHHTAPLHTCPTASPAPTTVPTVRLLDRIMPPPHTHATGSFVMRVVLDHARLPIAIQPCTHTVAMLLFNGAHKYLSTTLSAHCKQCER